MAGDGEYFRRRSAEEQRAAASATDPRAREAHLQMAERYSELASAIAAQEERLGVIAVEEIVS